LGGAYPSRHKRYESCTVPGVEKEQKRLEKLAVGEENSERAGLRGKSQVVGATRQ